MVALTWPGKSDFAALPGKDWKCVQLTEPDIDEDYGRKQIWDYSEIEGFNQLYRGDNLQVMDYLLRQGYEGCLDLIYIDPPFFSNVSYVSTVKSEKGKTERLAFRDIWPQGMSDYMTHLYPRLALMRQLLSEKGSLLIHLDWHAVHYVKVLLDEIFGWKNLINEIIWCYGGGGNSKRNLQRKHDTILWYGKTKNYIYNPLYRPYTAKTLQRGLTKVKGDKYKLRQEGAVLSDWWTDINKILSPTARENLNYPSQKPLALLERLLSLASNPDSIVADFYCGTGSWGQAANDLGRRWIMADTGALAIQTCVRRMSIAGNKPFALFMNSAEDWIAAGEIPSWWQEVGIKFEVGAEPDLWGNYHVGVFLAGHDQNDDYPLPSYVCFVDFWEVGIKREQGPFVSIKQAKRVSASFDHNLPSRLFLNLPESVLPHLQVKIWDINGQSFCLSLKNVGFFPY